MPQLRLSAEDELIIFPRSTATVWQTMQNELDE